MVSGFTSSVLIHPNHGKRQLHIYKISAGLSFNSGTTIKEILMEAITVIRDSGLDLSKTNLTELIEMVPLSEQTVSRRTKIIANEMERKTINDLKASPIGFCLQLDESIDVENVAQLVLFVRLVYQRLFFSLKSFW